MSVYARFTYTVQRHLEGSILLKWVIWHVAFFFACRAQDYSFCLLIVRDMLSDKVKGKSALKAWTFYMNVTKFMYVIGLCNSAGSNIFLTFIGEMFTYKKHSMHRNSSAMVTNMVTNIASTDRQGERARERDVCVCSFEFRQFVFLLWELVYVGYFKVLCRSLQKKKI